MSFDSWLGEMNSTLVRAVRVLPPDAMLWGSLSWSPGVKGTQCVGHVRGPVLDLLSLA